MAVSVRMDPVLEQELESAARRQGITKSQFIVEAVERALGRKDPHRLLEQARRAYGIAGPVAAPGAAAVPAPAPTRERLRRELRARHDAAMRDWLAYQEARRRGQPWSPEGEPEQDAAA